MNLYAYCLSDEATPDMIERAAGIEGANARLIEHESIKTVVSDFEGERARVTRENVFAHESIIHQILARTTPLPFRFGMVISAARLESYVATHRHALLAQLSRVRNAVEMSVKIIWDAEALKRAAVELTEGERIKSASEMTGPGAAFLAAKRREIAGSEALRKQGEEIAIWLQQRLGDTVRETSARVCPTEGMALAAAHLVERARLNQYRALIAEAREERDDLRFLMSGEWPPYSFCELIS
jgi:hypothetical protein